MQSQILAVNLVDVTIMHTNMDPQAHVYTMFTQSLTYCHLVDHNLPNRTSISQCPPSKSAIFDVMLGPKAQKN